MTEHYVVAPMEKPESLMVELIANQPIELPVRVDTGNGYERFFTPTEDDLRHDAMERIMQSFQNDLHRYILLSAKFELKFTWRRVPETGPLERLSLRLDWIAKLETL